MLGKEERLFIGQLFSNKRKSLKISLDEFIDTYLIKNDISYGQYVRAEQGKENVSSQYLYRIANALQVDLSQYFEAKNQVILSENVFCPEILYKHAKQRLFYISACDRNNVLEFHTRNLMIFMLYLPLFPSDLLWMKLNQIGGYYYDNEEYLCKQLSDLYASIPESKAKLYADYEAEGINHARLEDPLLELQWQNNYQRRRRSRKVMEAYDAYEKCLNLFLARNFFYEYDGGRIMMKLPTTRSHSLYLSISRIQLFNNEQEMTVKDVLKGCRGSFVECSVYQNVDYRLREKDFKPVDFADFKCIAAVEYPMAPALNDSFFAEEILSLGVLKFRLMGQDEYTRSAFPEDEVDFESWFNDKKAKVLIIIAA